MRNHGDSHSCCTHIHYKLMYFFIWGAMGVFIPYRPLYFESINFSKLQIGILSMIPNLSSFICAPVFSFMGDKYDKHYEIMIFSLVLVNIFTFSLLAFESYYYVLLIVIIASFFGSPIAPEIDSISMNALTDKTDYGSLR